MIQSLGFPPLWLVCVLCLLVAPRLAAQRAFEQGNEVIYEDPQGNQVNLGLGFGAVLTSDAKVVMVRGRRFGYGEEFDCTQNERKNRIAIYDPITRLERILFDGGLEFHSGGAPFCIFKAMQLSPDGRMLYLVSPVYATSGSLAIVDIAKGTIKYISGVNDVWVIESGAHRGELIYSRRLLHHIEGLEEEYPYYPFVHARADGEQIQVISDEYFANGGIEYTKAPVLSAYLRGLGGRIRVNGQTFP